MTPRQKEVAALLREGHATKEIAYRLKVTNATVKVHIMKIFRELKVHNRTQAALALRDMRL